MEIGLKKTSGLTLIEVIITIAILGVIFAAVTQFFGYNLKLFVRGKNMSTVQFDVRMGADYLTNELRNVVRISDKEIDNAEIINSEILKVKYSNIRSVTFSFVNSNNRKLLHYRIVGNTDDNKNEFILESEFLLNNDRKILEIPVEGVVFDTLYFVK